MSDAGDVQRGPLPELATEPSVPHARIAATSSAYDRLWRAAAARRGLRLTAAQVAALADAPALRAVLCELCRTCRACGCTEDFVCRAPDGGGCSWVEPDLCSMCAPRETAS